MFIQRLRVIFGVFFVKNLCAGWTTKNANLSKKGRKKGGVKKRVFCKKSDFFFYIFFFYEKSAHFVHKKRIKVVILCFFGNVYKKISNKLQR